MADPIGSPTASSAATSALPASGPYIPSSQLLRQITVDAAQAVGPALREAFRPTMAVQTESAAHDLVTEWDTATENRLVELLTAAVPNSRITGGESGQHGHGQVEWIIAQIDGTADFAHRNTIFSVSISAAIDDQVVAGVVHDPVHLAPHHLGLGALVEAPTARRVLARSASR